jgi:hypothetical protein
MNWLKKYCLKDTLKLFKMMLWKQSFQVLSKKMLNDALN